MKTLFRFSFLGFAAMVFLVGASAARADSSYNFTINGTGITGSGVIEVGTGSGFVPITGITGELNGQAITLDPVNTWGANDNLYNPAGNPFVDDFGVTFDAGGTMYNLYSWADYYNLAWNWTWATVDFQDDPAATPETSSFAMLGLGIIGVAAAFGFKRAFRLCAVEA